MKKRYNHPQDPKSGVGLAATDQRTLCGYKLTKKQRHSLCKCVVKSTVSQIWTGRLLLWTHFPYLKIRAIMTTSEDSSRIKWHNEHQACRAVTAHSKGREWHRPPAFLLPPPPSPSLSSTTSSTASIFLFFLEMMQNPEIIKKKNYQFNHI